MKIGVDLHGVLTHMPEVFKPLMQLWQANSIDVAIISGGPKTDMLQELTTLGYVEGIHFSEAYSIIDWLKTVGIETWQDKTGNWWAPEDDWWSAKGFIVEQHDIDLVIDDSVEYKENMPSGTAFMLLCQGVSGAARSTRSQCSPLHKQVDVYRQKLIDERKYDHWSSQNGHYALTKALKWLGEIIPK